MENVDIEIRLRPIRFGFVVRPNDGRSLRSIFKVNTCLWGGRYNPIIPHLSSVPKWWDRAGVRFDSAKQIMNGYIEYFEPDYLVEAEPGLARSLGYDEERVLKLGDVLRRSGSRDHRGTGLDVIDLYRKLYREAFQFVRRDPETVFDVSAEAPMADFAACLFGAFPTNEEHAYFHQAFTDAFAPTCLSLTADAFEGVYRQRAAGARQATALGIGSAHLEVDFNDHRDPTIFVLDASQPKDLLDFWNYRAVHREVWAIPIQWLGTLSGFCRDTISQAYRPLPGNPNGVMMRMTTMFSRSIPEDQIKQLYTAHIQTDVAGANVVQTWYPPIWRPSPSSVSRTSRPTLVADRRSIDGQGDSVSHLRFEGLSPEFASRFGGRARWANVVRLRDWSAKERLATVFPTDVRRSSVAGQGAGIERYLSTTEGLVSFREFKDQTHHLPISDGATAIGAWLAANGIKATPSEAGRPTQQIIQTLEGFYGVGALAHEGVLRALEHMARTPITHSEHAQAFKNRIKKTEVGSVWRSRAFEMLVDRHAVELGYELRCTRCGSWTWHKLSQLGAEITCDLCLGQFPFPATEPSKSSHARWAYRVIGPFALPNYAEGGYAAALALRFFGSAVSNLSGPEIAWSAGQNLEFADGAKAEADLIVWHQRKEMFGTDRPTEIVFGEAKSFGRKGEDVFGEVDVERMKRLATRFPGSICVFATLRDASELTPSEVARVRRFAEWGREYDRDRRETRAPVIVLTATELFAAHSVSFTWKEKGGLHARLIEPGYVSTERLPLMADFTQQLYLGMPPYDAWREKKWEARRAQRENRAAKKRAAGGAGAE